ncbi:MAG TPA: hypothetical protein DEA05_09920, partial [Rhodobacteraceae bacterium]|nr:hypothetical protein [Paracoccaceae bacterium]
MTHCPNGRTYARLHSRLTRRARRLVDDPETAADLAQEALLRLWRHQRQSGGPKAVEPFAMTILRNLAMSHFRARRPTCALDEDSQTEPSGAHAALALRDLACAVARLPPGQAELIGLVAEGVTGPADLARQTGLAPGTVMSRLARARATLEQCPKVG